MDESEGRAPPTSLRSNWDRAEGAHGRTLLTAEGTCQLLPVASSGPVVGHMWVAQDWRPAPWLKSGVGEGGRRRHSWKERYRGSKGLGSGAVWREQDAVVAPGEKGK